MLALVGQRFAVRLSDPISCKEVVRWERAVHWPSRAAPRSPDDPVPLEFNPFAYGPEVVPEPDPCRPDSFIEEAAGGAGPGATHGVNGELAVEYGVAMRVGQRISTVSHIDAYRTRGGSEGPLLLTDVVTQWHNEAGELIKRLRNTVVRW